MITTLSSSFTGFVNTGINDTVERKAIGKYDTLYGDSRVVNFGDNQ